jgi:hypothetical protein
MATDQIDWNQKRKVFYSAREGEWYVKVGSQEYMLDDDYINGGRTLHRVQVPSDIQEVGTFTNAQIDNGHHQKEQPE